MKIRLTFGNIAGAVLGGAAWLAGHSDTISSVVPAKYSTPLLALAATILFFAKGGTTQNADQIPDTKKAETTGVLFEKTGPLKPSTPTS